VRAACPCSAAKDTTGPVAPADRAAAQGALTFPQAEPRAPGAIGESPAHLSREVPGQGWLPAAVQLGCLSELGESRFGICNGLTSAGCWCPPSHSVASPPQQDRAGENKMEKNLRVKLKAKGHVQKQSKMKDLLFTSRQQATPSHFPGSRSSVGAAVAPEDKCHNNKCPSFLLIPLSFYC